MALVPIGTPRLNLTIRDNNRKISTTSFPIAATNNTLPAATATANAIRDALIGITDGRLLGASVSYDFTEDAPELVAAPESEVERKLKISLSNGQAGPVRSVISIPSPIAGIEQVNTDTVSPLQPQVAALLTALIGQVVTTRGEALTVADDLFVSHTNRKRR